MKIVTYLKRLLMIKLDSRCQVLGTGLSTWKNTWFASIIKMANRLSFPETWRFPCMWDCQCCKQGSPRNTILPFYTDIAFVSFYLFYFAVHIFERCLTSFTKQNTVWMNHTCSHGQCCAYYMPVKILINLMLYKGKNEDWMKTQSFLL